jgi:hypothetical protein
MVQGVSGDYNNKARELMILGVRLGARSR